MRVPLEIPPGIASDDTTFASPRWADGDNVRPWQGKMEVIGGWADYMNGATLTGVCRNILVYGKTSGGGIVAFGTHSALQVFQGGALYDITPAGLTEGEINGGSSGGGWGRGTWGSGTWGTSAGTYYPRTWSLSTWGSYLIANPRGGGIYEWQGDTGADALIITNAPTTVTYALVTPQRQLLAFGCNEEVSTDFNPLCIRGSDLEDNTDWTTTATNNAFEHILDASAGRIVAARLIGPYVAVWTDVSLFIGEFLGDPTQTYRFDRVGDNCGLIGPNAAEVIDNSVFWLAPDYQFRAWTIGGKVEVIPSPIGKEFRDNIDRAQVAKVAASAESQFNEVWWHYPDSRDGMENSRYIALGLTEGGGWFRGTMARTATVNAGVLQYPLKATYGGMVYLHEYETTADGAALPWSLRSGALYIDEGHQAVMVRGITPDFEGQAGDISITFHARQYPQDSDTDYGPYTLTAATLKYDLRFNARLVSVTLSGGDADGTFMRLGKPVLDVAPTGQR